MKNIQNWVSQLIKGIGKLISDFRGGGVLLKLCLLEAQKKIFRTLKIRERKEKIKILLEELLFLLDELIEVLLFDILIFTVLKCLFEIIKISYTILDSVFTVLQGWYSFLDNFNLSMFCHQNKITLYWSIQLGNSISIGLRILYTLIIILTDVTNVLNNLTLFIVMLSENQHTTYALQRLALKVAILYPYFYYLLNLLYVWIESYVNIYDYFVFHLQSAGYPLILIDQIFFTHLAFSFYVLFWFHLKIASRLMDMIDRDIDIKILNQLYIFYKSIARKFRDLGNKKDIRKEDKEKQDKEKQDKEKDSQNQNEE